jgi:outer membrane receptor for ferrienterochelin and colicin
VGLQVVGRIKNIIPVIQLQTNFAYSLQVGTEAFEKDFPLKEISQHRQVPMHTLQWSVAAKPHKKLYFNLDNVLMSGWYRRYVPVVTTKTSLPNQFIKGYYTLDFVGRFYFTKNLSSYIKIINVFDADYGGLSATGLDIDLYNMPQLGRNVQVGISFQLE